MTILLKAGAVIAALLALQLSVGQAQAQTPASGTDRIVIHGRLEALDTIRRTVRIAGREFGYGASVLVFEVGATSNKPENLGIGTQIEAVVELPSMPGVPATVTELRASLQ